MDGIGRNPSIVSVFGGYRARVKYNKSRKAGLHTKYNTALICYDLYVAIMIELFGIRAL